MRCDMIWYDEMRCGAMQYGAMRCGSMRLVGLLIHGLGFNPSPETCPRIKGVGLHAMGGIPPMAYALGGIPPMAYAMGGIPPMACLRFRRSCSPPHPFQQCSRMAVGFGSWRMVPRQRKRRTTQLNDAVLLGFRLHPHTHTHTNTVT